MGFDMKDVLSRTLKLVENETAENGKAVLSYGISEELLLKNNKTLSYGIGNISAVKQDVLELIALIGDEILSFNSLSDVVEDFITEKYDFQLL